MSSAEQAIDTQSKEESLGAFKTAFIKPKGTKKGTIHEKPIVLIFIQVTDIK
ncbi:MAG: hypothetical protein Q8L79_05080 [Methylobacter sp.]|uniref:hypothetical protein n=1 Tax=Methylobacter sp. TaxID=2051955 RepID=UPI00272F3241|nr:hypothetical protein [Methylobacter sp.]MDP1664483.1 hypothetical protein [Methylobacter sp.]